MQNFNDLKIPDAHILGGHPQRDYSTSNGPVAVHFKNLETALIGHIQRAQAVVGCVAWLTSVPVLEALGKVPYGVAIVVEKEKYLREDGAQGKPWLVQRQSLYKNVQNGVWLPTKSIGGAMAKMRSGPNFSREEDFAEFGSDEELVNPIRCMGQKLDAYAARMHNKFLVFCNLDHNADPPRLAPYAVWTGSFNFSRTATQSFENALVISDQAIANAYLLEFSQISTLAEKLNWNEEHVVPDLKQG